jgi:hypothetical protein
MARFLTIDYPETHRIRPGPKRENKQQNINKLKNKTMKKVTIILTGVILMTIASVNVKADGTQTKTVAATSSATIVTPIAITNSSDLAFGLLSPTGAAGTVVLTPASTTSRSANGVTLLGTLPVSSATYTITGETDALYKIDLPAGNIAITDGTNSMNVNNFTMNLNSTGNVMASGNNMLYVGATLNVPADQPHGEYVGSYNVTVTYE